jgi:competence protein ComEC
MLGGGIGLYFSLIDEPSWEAIATLVLATLVLCLLTYRWVSRALLAGLCLLVLGLTMAKFQSDRVSAPVLQRETGVVTVTGMVQGLETFSGGSTRIIITQLYISRFSPTETPANLRLTVRTKGDAVLPGDWLHVKAKLMPPSPPEAPNSFDFSRRAWFQQLGGIGYAVSPVIRADPTTSQEDWSLSTRIARWRAVLIERLMRQTEGDSGAMAVALLTGSRNLISQEGQESMRNAGLAHLLAISGLHIGLIASSIILIFRGFLSLLPNIALRYPIKKYAATVGLVTALAYLLISGGTIPTQRAFAMTAIVLIAIILDRLAITMRLVAVVAMGLLLVSPNILLSVSFQMSFGAVIALVAFYEYMRGKNWFLERRKSVGRSFLTYGLGVAATSLIAGLATGLIAAFHFNRYASWGLVANMISVPVMALWIMPAAILTFALLPFGLESWGLSLMQRGIEIVLWSADLVNGWPGAVLLVPTFEMAGFVLTMLGGLWLCLWVQPWRLWGVALMAIGITLAVAQRGPDILVSDDGKLFAVRDASDNLIVSNRRSSRRARELWLRQNAQDSAEKWSVHQETHGDEAVVSCDTLACIYRPVGHASMLVAFIMSPQALDEDCFQTDIVISAVPTHYQCDKASLVIDRFDLWRAGAHAIWLEGDDITIKTVADQQGRRPWSKYPPKPRNRQSKP